MAEYRRHIRVDDGERCHLRLRDAYYLVTVKDISLSGVLLQFSTPPLGFYVGDNCQVSLNEEGHYYYNCEVVRVEKHNIALKFIDIITSNAVEN